MGGFLRTMFVGPRVEAAVSESATSRDTAPLLDLLQEEPRCLRRVVSVGVSTAPLKPEASQWVALALVQLASGEAVSVLRALADAGHMDLSSVGQDAGQRVLDYLLLRHEIGLCMQFAEAAGSSGAAPSLDLLTDEQFDAWLDGAVQDNGFASVRDVVVGYLDRLAFESSTAQRMDRGVRHAYSAARTLWHEEHLEESLEILRLIVALHPRMDAQSLQAVASVLPRLVPDVVGAQVDLGSSDVGTYWTGSLQTTPHLAAAVGRAADILRACASDEWTDYIKEAWILASAHIREASIANDARSAPPDMIIAGNALAVALGVCAAASADPVAIESGEASIGELGNRLSAMIDARNGLVSRHTSLVSSYKGSRSVDHSEVESEIRGIHARIHQADAEIENLRFEIDDLQTPAFHLLSALQDGRSYPDGVRQGAAWGLRHILRRSDIDTAVRSRIEEALFRAMFGADSDGGCSPDEPAAAESGGSLGAAERALDSGFAERIMYMPPNASFLEIREGIRDGLRWTSDMIATEPDAQRDRRLDEGACQTVAAMRSQFPAFRGFLTRYPLRLMDLDHHRHLLGQYSRRKCDWTFWTRYTPPAWKPGMRPEEAGEVHRRYLTIDDRSLPMSMGIYYRLFEHPVLALPIVYHEFLHFGGPGGDPARAIENEAEVWLRETLYSQYLLATLAPDTADAVRDYEQGIADAVKRLDLPSMMMQICCDVSHMPSCALLCAMVESMYGEQVSADTAAARVEQDLQVTNIHIDLMNATDDKKLNWYPDISWPHVGSPDTRDVTEQYRRITTKALMARHRLSGAEIEAVIGDATSRYFLGVWREYCERSRAAGGVVGRGVAAERAMTEAAAALIVDRYGNCSW